MAEYSFSGSVIKEHHVTALQHFVDAQIKRNLGSTALLASPAVTWLSIAVCMAFLGYRAFEVGEGWLHYGALFVGPIDYLLGGIFLWILLGSFRSGSGLKRRVTAKQVEDVCISGVTMGPVKFSSDEAGLTVHFPERQTDYRWAAFNRITKLGEDLLLEMTKTNCVIVPGNAFRDPAERQAFREFAEAKIAAA